MTSRMNRTVFVLLWVFTFVIPWEDVNRIPGFGSMGRVAGAATIAAAVVHVLAARRVRPLSWFLLFGIVFVVWAALSSFWTVDSNATRIRVITYAQLVVFGWLVWEFAPLRERQLKLLQAYVLGAYVAVISTLMNYFAGVSLEANAARFAGLDYNPNDLGFTVALGLPMAWYLSISQPGTVLRWPNRLFVPLGMATILLTASRGAFIPALAALLLIPWTLPRLRARAKVATCILGLGALLFVQRLAPDDSLQRLATTGAEIETGSFGKRGNIWKAGLEVFSQHPLVGVGAGGFDTAVEPVLGYRKPPHQTFLSVLVGQGIIGFLLFAGLFASAMTSLSRMAGLERKFWLVMLLTLGIGLMPRTWDYRKPPWLILGLLATRAAVSRAARPSWARAEYVAGSGPLMRVPSSR